MGNFILYRSPKSSYKYVNDDPTFVLVPQKDGEDSRMNPSIISSVSFKSLAQDLNFKIPCRYIQCQNRRSPYLIIFFHANSEDIGENLSHFLLSIGKRFDMDILCPEYPTYGVYKNRSGEQSLDQAILKDARATMDFCTQVLRFKPENIILMGRSLGTGVAVQLATQYNVRGVVLVSPFTSIRAVAKNLVGKLLSKIMPNVFRSIDKIDQIQSPILFIHGEKDALIPPEMSKKLYSKAKGPKSIKVNKFMTHNQIKLERDIFQPLEKFMVEVLDLEVHLEPFLKTKLRASLYSRLSIQSRQSQDSALVL